MVYSPTVHNADRRIELNRTGSPNRGAGQAFHLRLIPEGLVGKMDQEVPLAGNPILHLVKDVTAPQHHHVPRAQGHFDLELRKLQGARVERAVVDDDGPPPMRILSIEVSQGEPIELELATFEPHGRIHRRDRFLTGYSGHTPVVHLVQAIVLLRIRLLEGGHDVSCDDRKLQQDVACTIEILLGYQHISS